MQPIRQTAKICSVQDLLSGTYVVQEGWKPNYVQTSLRKISRVNIMGFVVDKQTPNQFVLDDGTGSINIIDFSSSPALQHIAIGDPALVVGRPRKSEEELFIAAEIIATKQLKKEPVWLHYRKQQLEHVSADVVDESFVTESEETSAQNSSADKKEKISLVIQEFPELSGDAVFDFVKAKDSGDGCEIELIIKEFGQEADDLVLTLISMGELYEIKPGRLKVLE
jgi:RPA family protein